MMSVGGGCPDIVKIIPSLISCQSGGQKLLTFCWRWSREDNLSPDFTSFSDRTTRSLCQSSLEESFISLHQTPSDGPVFVIVIIGCYSLLSVAKSFSIISRENIPFSFNANTMFSGNWSQVEVSGKRSECKYIQAPFQCNISLDTDLGFRTI